MLLVEVPVGCDRLGGGVFDWIRASHHLREGAAQEGPAEQQQRGGGPADVDRRADLPLLGRRHQRVVEVHYDVVGHPAERDQHEQPADDVGDPPGVHHSSLHRLILDTVGALRPGDRHRERHDPQHGGDDRQGPGRLQVLRQGQDRVVDFALHLAGALHHAGHPQAVPDGLSHHDVGVDESGHLPHRQPARDHHQQRARDAQRQAEELQTRSEHGSDPPGPDLRDEVQVSALTVWMLCARSASPLLTECVRSEAFHLWDHQTDAAAEPPSKQRRETLDQSAADASLSQPMRGRREQQHLTHLRVHSVMVFTSSCWSAPDVRRLPVIQSEGRGGAKQPRTRCALNLD